MALLAWWPLNGELTDNSIRKRDLTILGTPSIGDGLLEESYYFSNTGNSALKTNVGTGINPSDGFSIAVWAKSDTPSGNRLFFAVGNGSNQRYYISQHDGKWEFAVRNIAWNTAHSVIPVVAGEWTHLTLVTQGLTTSLYVNGEFSHSKEHALFSFATDFNLGNHGPGSESTSYQFRGYLQDARIYDHVLSVKEIKDIMRLKVLHYSFNKNEDVIHDISGYGNVAEKIGNPIWENNSYITTTSKYIKTYLNPLQDTPSKLTLSVWAKATSTAKPFDGLIQMRGKTNHSGGFVLSFSNNDTTFRLRHWNDGGTNRTWTTGIMGNLTNITVTIDGKTIKIYENGVLKDTSTASNNFNFGEQILIGLYEAETSYFQGNIYDVKLYSSVLAAEDIANLYAARASVGNRGSLHINEIEEVNVINLPIEGSSHTNDYGNAFEVDYPLILQSVEVYPYFTGELDVVLHEYPSGNEIYTRRVSVVSGKLQRIPLEFKLETGTQYWIGRKNPSGSPLMRHDMTFSLPSQQGPFYILTGNTLTPGTHYNKIYYFFNYMYTKLAAESTGEKTVEFPLKTGASYSNDYGNLLFVKTPIILKSASVRPYYTGELEILLYNYDTKELINKKVVNVTTGDWMEIDIGFILYPGINYWMGRTTGALLRTDTFTVPFVSGTYNHVKGTRLDLNDTALRNYYFFDIKYEEISFNKINNIGIYNTNEIEEYDELDIQMKMHGHKSIIKGSLNEE